VDARTLLLDTARRDVAQDGALPSLDRLARETGLSKGGVTHHFPTKASLVNALIIGAVEVTDREMAAAAVEGRAVEKWLALSSESTVGDTSVSTLARIALDARASLGEITDAIAAAAERWEALLAAELGSPAQARVVRLVGDGMLLSTLIDDRAPTLTLDELMAVVGGRR
jgi:AcrR family transcriptional regulator